MTKKLDFKKIGIKAAGLGLGAVGAGFGNKLLPNLNPYLRGALKIGVGVLLPVMIPKQQFLEHVGDGMIAVGVLDVAKTAVPALAGIGMDDDAVGDAAYIQDYETQLGSISDDQAISQDDEESM